jgi:ribosome maturation factor RimP
MIHSEFIKDILQEELTKHGLFLVEVKVGSGNHISVYADSMKGITVDECMMVSRFLEQKLDREKEDFELEVSSPGLSNPLKLPVQFEKNKGKMLDVIKTDGNKITGRLLETDPEAICLQSEAFVKDAKTHKKATETKEYKIKFNEIKTAKVVISLKK